MRVGLIFIFAMLGLVGDRHVPDDNVAANGNISLDEAISRAFTALNTAGSAPVFDEAVSRSITVLNTAGSTPVYEEAISRSFTVINTAGSSPEFDEAISRAFTVCNAAGADPGTCDCDTDSVPDPQDVCPCTAVSGGVDDQGRPLGDLDGDCDVDLEDFRVFQVNFGAGAP